RVGFTTVKRGRASVQPLFLSLDRQAALALAAAKVRSMSARARARRSARAASFAAFCAASARRARKSEVRYGLLLDMVLISDQLAEPNGSSKCRYRGSG